MSSNKFYPIEGMFNSRQLSEILYSLEGKREIPRKYGYFGTGVEKWNKKSIQTLEEMVISQKTKKFNMFKIQYQMIRDYIEIAFNTIPKNVKVNVVDVGCGTGLPVYPVLEYLTENDQLAQYIAVDIVSEMADLAIQKLTSLPALENMKCKKIIHDFEDGHFADSLISEKDPDTVNVFCFFSNTLGNMIDRHRALANLRDTMTSGDLLWIGNTMIANADNLVNFYQNLEINSPEYMYYHGDALAFFDSFGMDWSKYGVVEIRKSNYEGLLNYIYMVNHGFSIEIPAQKEDGSVEVFEINFEEGDEVIFNRLKNYPEADFLQELKEAGYKIKMMNLSDDGMAGLVLVSV